MTKDIYCNVCGEFKSHSEFSIGVSAYLHGICKSCMVEVDRVAEEILSNKINSHKECQ